MKRLSPYSMSVTSRRLTSRSGRPARSPCTVAMRSRHGPRRGSAPAAGRSAPERAACASARSARSKARLNAARSSGRRHAPPDHEVAVLRRPPQRLASRAAEADQRIDRPRMQPMRAEIDGMPLEGHGHGAPADAVARFEDRDRKPGRAEAAARPRCRPPRRRPRRRRRRPRAARGEVSRSAA